MNASSSEAVVKASSEDSPNTYSDFWEAPPRFWKPRVREMSEAEMNAIMVRHFIIQFILFPDLFFPERRCLLLLIISFIQWPID